MSMISLLKTDMMDGAKNAEQLIRHLLLPFGGGEFFFCPGEKVVFLADVTLPADNETGANFDIRLLWALLHLAKEQGIKELTVCIKPENGFTIEQILKNTSYGKLAELPGIRIVDLSQATVTPHPTDSRLVLEYADIYDELNSADVIISLAKFKTAENRLFGGALANAAYAADFPQDLSFELKQRALVDVYSIVSPDLTIVDCIKGQSGFQNNISSCVMAGSDAVALDTVLCAMADLDINNEESLVLASQYGMGISNPADIAMFGDDLREIMAGGSGSDADNKKNKLN